MTAHEVVIHREKCVGCGLCAGDCAMKKICMEDGKPQFNEKECIFCGHCEAICPMDAIEITGYAEAAEPSEKVTLDPETLLKLMKNRRSIRKFKNKKVDPKALEQILEAGRLSHTGKNRQNCTFYVLEDKIHEAEAIAVNKFRRLIGDAIDDHFFFFNAPMAIVITSPYTPDGLLAAQNMEFLAEANGLGCVFCGFFTEAVNMSKELKEFMGLEKGTEAVMTLVLGYPDIKYRKVPRREEVKVVKL